MAWGGENPGQLQISKIAILRKIFPMLCEGVLLKLRMVRHGV